MVHTPTEAKRLLIEKVMMQARLERVSLSDAERTMLSWSELAAEISDEEYEKKVTGSLVRRFAAELSQDPGAGAQAPAIQQRWALIPAGTGFELYRHVRIQADEPPPPTPEELELEGEMEYLVEPEEAFTRDEIE